ncbi:cyclic AMP receptor-like protein C isoform X2 [Lineus longissimus]
MQVVGYIDFCASLLSLCGSSSILISIAYKWKAYSKHEIQPIFYLSLADWLASFFLMICCIMYMETQSNDEGPCLLLTGITMIFYCNTFFLTLCYAGEVVLKLKLVLWGVTPRDDIPISVRVVRHVMYAISWLFPIIGGIVVMCLIFREWSISKSDPAHFFPVIPMGHDCSTCIPLFHYNEDICWEWTTSAFFRLRVVVKYLFLIPLILTFVGNFAIYFYALKLVPQIQRKRGSITNLEHTEKQMTRNKAILYQMVFLMCWIPSLLLGFISMSGSFNMNTFFPLFVTQACTAPLQGFWNSFIYGWKKESFRRPFRVTRTGDTLLRSTDTGYGTI